MIFLLSVFTLIPSAFSWDHHHAIMQVLAESPSALKRSYLAQKVKLPCAQDEREMIQKLAAELQINANKVPVITQECAKNAPGSSSGIKTVSELIASDMIDEPDFGMDQDLPDSADPENERAHMGGKVGPTSQGFRHMYFPGLRWSSPLDTFQLPFHAIGQAPQRFEKLHAVSDRFFKEGNVFWGLRTLLWSLHFVQDLHQPFHVAQVPYFKMLPWKNLFSGFVQRSTQTITNFHYAYEDLILEYVKDADVSDFGTCFEGISAKPVADIYSIIDATRSQAPALGKALYRLFGDRLKSSEIDLPNGKGEIDYYALIHTRNESLSSEEKAALSAADLAEHADVTNRLEGLKQTREISCELMRSLSADTWGELDRAFRAL